MTYTGYYINLDRSTARRAQLEAELATHGLTGAYRRFTAADGNVLGIEDTPLKDGEIGCFASHRQLLSQNLDSPQHLHVIEDDVIFGPRFAQIAGWSIEQGFLDQFDILYTDTFVPLLNDAYRFYKQLYDETVMRNAAGGIDRIEFRVIDLARQMFASTSSFFVSRNAIRKLHDLLAGAIAQGLQLPIDLFIRQQTYQGKLRTGCLFPFITSIRLEDTLTSSIAGRHDDLSALATDLGRYSFFTGCDWRLCETYLRRYLASPGQPDRHAKLLANILTFSLTDRFKAV